MNSLTEARQGQGFETDATEGGDQEHRESALFHSDTGELPLETRRTLVQLLLTPAWTPSATAGFGTCCCATRA